MLLVSRVYAIVTDVVVVPSNNTVARLSSLQVKRSRRISFQHVDCKCRTSMSGSSSTCRSALVSKRRLNRWSSAFAPPHLSFNRRVFSVGRLLLTWCMEDYQPQTVSPPLSADDL